MLTASGKTIGHDREEDHDKDLADLEDPAEDRIAMRKMKMGNNQERAAQAAQVGTQILTVEISRTKANQRESLSLCR